MTLQELSFVEAFTLMNSLHKIGLTKFKNAFVCINSIYSIAIYSNIWTTSIPDFSSVSFLILSDFYSH